MYTRRKAHRDRDEWNTIHSLILCPFLPPGFKECLYVALIHFLALLCERLKVLHQSISVEEAN